MKIVLTLSCLCAMAVSMPVGEPEAFAEFPSYIQVEASNSEEAVKKAIQLIDLYNGHGFFDNGDDFRGGEYVDYKYKTNVPIKAVLGLVVHDRTVVRV